MRIWIERGFSRLPIAQRMLALRPRLQLMTSPSQTPDGASPLAMPVAGDGEEVTAIARLVEEHQVDAFWPQNAARLDLTSLPCAVHAAGTPGIVALVDDKQAFMEWLGDDPHRPDQVEVVGASGVLEEYATRAAAGRATCVKPAIGVNGHGYWRLVDQGGAAFLDDPEPREIDPEVWATAMRLAERTQDPRRLLVMDWLPGPEVSIDMLCWRGRALLHAARTKIDPNHQRIEGDHPVVGHARGIAERLGLHGIVSMQYRLDQAGAWRMLEVNPRPAGGSIHSEDAGFDVIGAWTRLLCGEIGPDDVRQVHGSRTVRFVRAATIVED